ncbi:hypothetical protein [Christiangramia sabulilitoris]|uniref:NIPSNAP family protein n=1 Tax=Christiangramia sabulilitoris TaxID=2583991 RepID=A0A550I6Z4_9FLAO|nr:hypothetical protein [Christiangramia sabulilitoris]TRO66744.1 hypothetical protein FGM01_02315 [Christiangramia sabulilitoris]
MKSIKTLFTAIFALLFMGFTSFSQSDRYQMFVVHEDHVKKDMIEKHHEADKNMVKLATQHNMDMEWLAFAGDEGRLMYLTAIDNMAELDKNPFADLQKKMGDEEYKKMFDAYDDTYTKHGDYIIRLDKELSYMPDGMTQTPEGEDYRALIYYHIPPGKEDQAEELAKKAKKIYEDKNSNLHYRLYKSGFGTMGNYYMVAVSAKSPEDLEMKMKKNDEVLGEKRQELIDEIEKIFPERETVTGFIRQDLSYLNKK